jgi:hypothetical protein
MSAPAPLPSIKKGSTPTFLDTDFAQKAVDILNALINATIIPAGSGVVYVAKDQLVIDLSALVQTISNDNPVSTGGGGGSSGSSASSSSAQTNNQISNIQQQLTNLTNAINNATITCNGDGSITWTPGS